MSLPNDWVDAIFRKLTLVYGSAFLKRWEGIEIDAVKADWAHELSGLAKKPEFIKHALENLPVSYPPTVLEFRQLCIGAPTYALPALPKPKAKPEDVARVRELVAKAFKPKEAA
jgi:hypothetical protein